MKRVFFIAAMLATFIYAHSQTKSSYLKVSHVTSGSVATDEIAFNGGEITILDNAVTVAFAANPGKNKTYAFDKLLSFVFETRNETAVSVAEEVLLNVFIDESGLLHIRSTQAIGEVRIYSVTGILTAQTTSQSGVADINLSDAPKGVYIVQAGDCKKKIVKH